MSSIQLPSIPEDLFKIPRLQESLPMTLRGIIDENEFREQVRFINDSVVQLTLPHRNASTNFLCFMCFFVLFGVLTFGIGMLLLLPCMFICICKLQTSSKEVVSNAVVMLDEISQMPKWRDRGIAWRLQVDQVPTGHKGAIANRYTVRACAR